MRQQGQYADSAATAYGGLQVQHDSGQMLEQGFNQLDGELEAFTPERETSYASSKPGGQWRWVRDEAKATNSVASQMLNEGQLVDSSRPYFQGKGSESHMDRDQQASFDTRSRLQEDDMHSSYKEKSHKQIFEGHEQKCTDEIMKLVKELSDVEDAEIARHKERLKSINDQHQRQLAALRARHAGHREEMLRKESEARQHRYQLATLDHYPTNSNSMAHGESLGYSVRRGSAPVNEVQQAYNNASHFDSYQEQAQFLGNNRDTGFKPRAQPGGRGVYDTGARY